MIGFLRGRALLFRFLPGQFDKDFAQDFGMAEHIVLGHGADLVGMRLDIIGDDRLDFFARHGFVSGRGPERKHQSGGQEWRKVSGFQSSSPGGSRYKPFSQNMRGAPSVLQVAAGRDGTRRAGNAAEDARGNRDSAGAA